MTALPMAGVKVLEVAQYTFVPVSGAVLADWGADVIKVEHAERGDAQRGLMQLGNVTAGGDFAPLMEHPNRGKRSIGLALDKPEALEVLYEIVRNSDVFVTNFLPAARRKLKIDLEDIRKINPDIIYVRGTAMGVRGAESEKGGYDSTMYWCRGGSAMGVTPADQDVPLSQPGPAYGDTIGGLSITSGIAAALYSRAVTGETSVVDVSLLGVGAWANALSIDLSLMSGQPWRPMSLGGVSAPTNPLVGNYLTSDKRSISFTMLQPFRYWRDVCVHIGRPELADDDRFDTVEKLMANTADAAELLRAAIGGNTFEHWMTTFATLDGQWAPVQDSVDIGRDPQMRANDLIREVIDVNGKTQELVVAPVQFDETPVDLVRAPQFAEHTDDLLRELGHDDDQIIALKIAGAVT